MARKDARRIGEFKIVPLSEVPGKAWAPITDGEGSDVDRILRALQKGPGLAAKIHGGSDPAIRKSLGPLINRIALSRDTPVRYRWREDFLYVWLDQSSD
jgi:hypothetical protein